MEKAIYEIPSLFVCCRSREKGESCAEKGSEELVRELKEWAKKEGIKGQVKVRKSSCLGQCEKGIAAFYSGSSEMWRNIQAKTDLDAIKEVLMADSCLTSENVEI